MGRPTSGYRLKDGSKVPGVTTIIGSRKETGGLLWWANRLAFDPLGQAHALLEGVAREEANLEAIWEFLQTPMDAYDHNKVRDQAATSGTLAHAMVENYLTGKDPEIVTVGMPPEVVEKAENAYLAFLEWANTTNLEVVDSELSLVSEKHGFGGTMDGRVVTIQGRRGIADWKTSNGLYPDMLIQVAAYKALYEENFPDEKLDGGLHIFRFSKEDGDFTHKSFDALPEAWRMFLLLREAYDIDKQLKKRAK